MLSLETKHNAIAKGAFVIGAASGKNEQFVRDLRADEFVDYTRQPFEEVIKDVDVVFDTIGGDTQERAFQTLKKGGFLVTSGYYYNRKIEVKN